MRWSLAPVFGLALLIAFNAAPIRGAQDKGAEEITLPGGPTGNVHFPHREHQQALNDCKVCHDLYPQQAGAIAGMKAAGQLKDKQVMNTQCTACHRQRKRAGEKAGPTTCSKCHVK